MKNGRLFIYSFVLSLLIVSFTPAFADDTSQIEQTKVKDDPNQQIKKVLLIAGSVVVLAGVGGMLLHKSLDKKKEKGNIQSPQDNLAFSSPFMPQYISPSISPSYDDSFFDATFPDVAFFTVPALPDLQALPDASFNGNQTCLSDGDHYLSEFELAQRKNDQALADLIYDSTRFDKTIRFYSRPDSKSTLNIKRGLDVSGNANLTLEFNDKSQSHNLDWYRSAKREIPFPKSKEELRELISQFRHKYHFDSNTFL